MPLGILILSDGRPGHYTLSEGIAAALARDTDIAITRIEVRRGKWHGAALAALTTSHLAPRVLFEKIYRQPATALGNPHLIVSAGAETLAANIWAARITGALNVFYGSIRLYDPQDFALVLTSYADRASRPRHAMTLKPSPTDPASVAPAPFTPDGTPFWPPRTAALVVGGDSRGITYSPRDWDDILAFMDQMSAEHGTRWLVANSRRTPPTVSDRLADQSTTGAFEFLDVRTAGPGTMVPLLARADVAFCTADSSTMVSECVWLQRPTVAIAPRHADIEANEAGYRDWLASNQWIARLDTAALNLRGAGDAVRGLRRMPANPQSALAKLIRSRLPDLPGPTPRTSAPAYE